MNIEQRISILEKKVGVRTLKEKIEPSNVTRIKYSGGYLKRFTRNDWMGWSGATRFEDGGEPFINDSVKVNPSMVEDLETRFEERFENEATVIFDQPDDQFWVSIYYTPADSLRAYYYTREFPTFEAAVRWINNSLGKVINEPMTINNIELL